MRTLLKTGLFVLCVGAILFGILYTRTPKPLWPGARYTEHDRDAAVERGLQFIDHTASDPRFFSSSGHDVLLCFYTISSTAKDKRLRAMARAMGEDRARQWRRENPTPPTAYANDLRSFVIGANAADKLLGPDEAMKPRVREAATHFSSLDFLDFDPTRPPRLSDIPQPCSACNMNGVPAGVCLHRCKPPADSPGPYGVWLDALITTYMGDSYGVQLGASYPEVLRWISAMRPYPMPKDGDDDELSYAPYAVTHVIYTLNDYGRYRLSPQWLPQEFHYLEATIHSAEEDEDGELLGEYMDTLRAFGRDESSPEIQVAMDYLLAHQNPDGSWGDPSDDNLYNRYHATWTAIDGLRQYAYQEERLLQPDLLPLIRGSVSAPSLNQAALR